MLVLSEKDLQRFWARVDHEHPTEKGCWLWRGSVWNQYGHGRLWLHGKDILAHRLMWILHYGYEPILYVLHKCDVPLCVNPEHLFLGTQTDNMKDRSAKGRARGQHPGEGNTNAKLTEADVLEIRRRVSSGEKHASIAIDFGVNQSQISRASRGVTWRRKEG